MKCNLKTIIFISLLFSLLSCNKINALDLTGREYTAWNITFRFQKTEVMIEQYDDTAYTGPTGIVNYSIANRSGVDYLILDSNGYEVEYLIIQDDWLLFLYDGDRKDPIFIGITSHPSDLVAFSVLGDLPLDYEASSYYQFGQEMYPPENLGRIELFQPWCEGVEGFGVGETIIVRNADTTITLSNGFVSYSRPELYEWNSRIKSIKVRSLLTDESFIVDLEDTPHLQYFVLPVEGKSDYEITILEVYPGEKFEDACVNFIFS